MMLEELQRRNHSEITTRKYLPGVSDFAKHFGRSPDQLGPNELRTYQALAIARAQGDARRCGSSSARHFHLNNSMLAIQIEHSAQLPDVEQQGVGTKLLRIQTHL